MNWLVCCWCIIHAPQWFSEVIIVVTVHCHVWKDSCFYTSFSLLSTPSGFLLLFTLAFRCHSLKDLGVLGDRTEIQRRNENERHLINQFLHPYLTVWKTHDYVRMPQPFHGFNARSMIPQIQCASLALSQLCSGNSTRGATFLRDS